MLFFFVEVGAFVSGKATEIAWIVANSIKKFTRVEIEGEAGGVCHFAKPESLEMHLQFLFGNSVCWSIDKAFTGVFNFIRDIIRVGSQCKEDELFG